MTINFSQGEGTPLQLVTFSENLFLDAADDLRLAIVNVKEGETGDGKAVLAALRDLKAAFHTVMEERTKLEKYRRQVGSDLGGTELDLGAARDEIGRRLARLRNAAEC